MSREEAIKDAALKPCPLCGGRAIIEKSTIQNGRYYVRCENPECNYTYKNPLEALIAWNKLKWYEKEITRLTAELKAKDTEIARLNMIIELDEKIEQALKENKAPAAHERS